MKIITKQKSLLTSLIGGLILTTNIYAEAPAQILVNNETSLSLSTSIAGLPGKGISPNVTQQVGYTIVSMGCHYGGNPTNCPIEFTNRDNGELVASVYIDVLTATVTQAPVFYGEYANKYEVVGWQASPITEIKISAK